VFGEKGGKGSDCRSIKDGAQREGDAESMVDADDYLGGGEGIVADVEEIIVDADDCRVILIERVMPALAKDAPDTVRVDLHMLAVTGGRERSEAEYQGLLEAAGFGLGRAVATRSPFCVIEGVPR
jgi:hypothetical protein